MAAEMTRATSSVVRPRSIWISCSNSRLVAWPRSRRDCTAWLRGRCTTSRSSSSSGRPLGRHCQAKDLAAGRRSRPEAGSRGGCRPSSEIAHVADNLRSLQWAEVFVDVDPAVGRLLQVAAGQPTPCPARPAAGRRRQRRPILGDRPFGQGSPIRRPPGGPCAPRLVGRVERMIGLPAWRSSAGCRIRAYRFAREEERDHGARRTRRREKEGNHERDSGREGHLGCFDHSSRGVDRNQRWTSLPAMRHSGLSRLRRHQLLFSMSSELRGFLCLHSSYRIARPTLSIRSIVSSSARC